MIDHGGVPRKYLFDLDRDSIIELEMWDPDGDGEFETRRQARLPIPAFLLPPPPPPEYDLTAALDRIARDSLARFDRYGPLLARAYHPSTAPPDTAPRLDRFRPRILQGEDPGRDRHDDPAWRTAPGPLGPRLLGEPTADRAPTARPRRTDTDGADRPPAPARDRDDRRPAAPPDQAPTRPAAEPTPPGERPPGRPGPKLLGRPVDSIPPPPRPDTTGTRR